MIRRGFLFQVVLEADFFGHVQGAFGHAGGTLHAPACGAHGGERRTVELGVARTFVKAHGVKAARLIDREADFADADQTVAARFETSGVDFIAHVLLVGGASG